MKKTIIFTMLIAFTAASFGQQVPASTPTPTQTDYLKKSKNQKTAAWILLGTGVALFTGGLIAHYNYINNPDHFWDAITFKVTTGEAIATVGFFSALGSIPLFITSSKNKKKANAASVFFDIKKAPMLQETVIRNQFFPAVGLRIGL